MTGDGIGTTKSLGFARKEGGKMTKTNRFKIVVAAAVTAPIL